MDDETFEVLDVYVGDDSILYYDDDGEQHSEAVVEENE